MIFNLRFQTSFGEAAVVFRRKPFAILKTILPRADSQDLIGLVQEKAFGNQESHKKALAVAELIVDYFRGKPLAPPWEWMDMGGLTRLQQAVLVATADIPHGQLKSYKNLAEAIGRPRAYRFVGSALANNPFPILIPCHRVVRSDGSLGNFGGGTDLKRRLIQLEASGLNPLPPGTRSFRAGADGNS